MTIAFSNQERTEILRALKQTALRYAGTLGMRKTSVEQLAQAAHISKGAFYKFYASKELLYFELLEDIHSEVYALAKRILRENAALPAAERGAKALLAVCYNLETRGLLAFLEHDVPYLLRKVPKEIQLEHYHSDEVHIQELLSEMELIPKGGIALAAATIRGLLLTVSHKEEIGDQYPAVLELLVYGACRELFPER